MLTQEKHERKHWLSGIDAPFFENFSLHCRFRRGFKQVFRFCPGITVDSPDLDARSCYTVRYSAYHAVNGHRTNTTTTDNGELCTSHSSPNQIKRSGENRSWRKLSFISKAVNTGTTILQIIRKNVGKIIKRQS